MGAYTDSCVLEWTLDCLGMELRYITMFCPGWRISFSLWSHPGLGLCKMLLARWRRRTDCHVRKQGPLLWWISRGECLLVDKICTVPHLPNAILPIAHLPFWVPRHHRSGGKNVCETMLDGKLVCCAWMIISHSRHEDCTRQQKTERKKKKKRKKKKRIVISSLQSRLLLRTSF